MLDGGRLLIGGALGRAVRLSDAGAAVLAALRDRTAADGAGADQAAGLATRLVAAGLAHPDPVPVAPAADRVTVVVPVHRRVGELRRCLAALGGVPVVVVDDASPHPEAADIAATCTEHGARLLRLPVNAGPAAARTAGVALTTTPLIAFVDSDVEVEQGWLDRLLGHLDDPSVALAAPRITPRFDRPDTLLARYGAHRCPLDLGSDPAAVRPRTRVAYVPTAAVVVRRTALEAVGGFDPDLRVGEDVDLVWRLHATGWTARYDPSVRVHHAEPPTWRALLGRRRSYGTSAAPLAVRHPGQVTHVVASPVAVATTAALAARRPVLAALVVAVAAARLARALHPLGVPAPTAAAMAAEGTVAGIAGLLRGTAMLTWPAWLLLALTSRRRAATIAALVAAPALADAIQRRPDVDPVRWVLASTVDDAAYGMGVLSGCVRHRTADPLRPQGGRTSRRP